MLAAFLESVALVSDADAVDPAKGAVTLMTLHAAKGLEFDAITIVGLEEGLLPHVRALGNELELEEERRLCYVGMTRARRHLLLTHTTVRTLRGMRESRIGSQFLRELPEAAVQRLDHSGMFDPWAEDGDDDDRSGVRYEPLDEDAIVHGGVMRTTSRSARSAAAASTAKFPVGSLVRHPTFGLGRVEAIMPRATGAAARIAFNSAGTKTLILEYARLERVR
jgi:DNA helicase-2/ATP-dependent DNA helicase PcrA